PIWINPNRISSPKVDQWVGVSTTTSPVKQTAEVEVNKAVTRSVDLPGAVAAGRSSRTVPIAITAAKANTTIRAGRYHFAGKRWAVNQRRTCVRRSTSFA